MGTARAAFTVLFFFSCKQEETSMRNSLFKNSETDTTFITVLLNALHVGQYWTLPSFHSIDCTMYFYHRTQQTILSFCVDFVEHSLYYCLSHIVAYPFREYLGSSLIFYGPFHLISADILTFTPIFNLFRWII